MICGPIHRCLLNGTIFGEVLPHHVLSIENCAHRAVRRSCPSPACWSRLRCLPPTCSSWARVLLAHLAAVRLLACLRVVLRLLRLVGGLLSVANVGPSNFRS